MSSYKLGSLCKRGHDHGGGSNRYISSRRCITCAAEMVNWNNAKVSKAKWRANNREADNINTSKWQKKYRAKLKISGDTKYLKLLEVTKIRAKRWRVNNPHRMNAIMAKRRAVKKLAFPIWADKESIRDKYEFCKLWSELLQRKYQVDHIVPLQNENVCGLHVADNLRVITAIANREKSNNFIGV